jgi:hypothetical protein
MDKVVAHIGYGSSHCDWANTNDQFYDTQTHMLKLWENTQSCTTNSQGEVTHIPIKIDVSSKDRYTLFITFFRVKINNDFRKVNLGPRKKSLKIFI